MSTGSKGWARTAPGSEARRIRSAALRWLAIVLSISAFALIAANEAASQVSFSVSGTSTIRGWTCTVDGDVDVSGGDGDEVPGLGGVGTATLSVDVMGFECPQEEMQEHLREAMRADEFPRITFVLSGYNVNGGQAIANGSLTILDQTHDVRVPLTVAASGSSVRIAGEIPLDMTDYGVEPPEVMMGLLVVRPAIRIEFSGVVGS